MSGLTYSSEIYLGLVYSVFAVLKLGCASFFQKVAQSVWSVNTYCLGALKSQSYFIVVFLWYESRTGFVEMVKIFEILIFYSQQNPRK
jgi:hypothetical protein